MLCLPTLKCLCAAYRALDVKALLPFGNLEAIARSAYGLEIARIFGIDFDFLTDAAHINVHRTRRNKACIAPHGVEKVIAAEAPARMARQVVEQPELGGRGGGQLAAHLELHCVRV